MSPPRPWRRSAGARIAQRLGAVGLALVLANCAILPGAIDDPIGVKAAHKRCTELPREQRTLPSWFAIFGPALACR